MARLVAVILIGIGGMAVTGCGASSPKTPDVGRTVDGPSEEAKIAERTTEELKVPQKTIEQVQAEHTDAWMALPGVVGIAIGEAEGEACIKVLVVEKTKELTSKIPSSVDGYRVILQETGEIRALDDG